MQGKTIAMKDAAERNRSALEFGQNISIECRQQSVGAREFVVGDEADWYRAGRCFAVASLDTPFDGMKNGSEFLELAPSR